MTEREIERIIERVIVETIAERILARLAARRRRLLAVFCETTIGLPQAAAALRALRAEGWSIRAVGSPTACRMVAEAGHGDLAVSPATEPDLETLIGDCRTVVAATLSIDAAAKLAYAFRDDLVSRLVARALERGLPVVAAVDGACPDDPERARRGFAVTSAYRERLRANLETVASWGVRLVRSERLADAVRPSTAPIAAPDLPDRRRTAPRDVGGGGGVFGRSDAFLFVGDELRLPRATIVTPLAADALVERGIRLIRT